MYCVNVGKKERKKKDDFMRYCLLDNSKANRFMIFTYACLSAHLFKYRSGTFVCCCGIDFKGMLSNQSVSHPSNGRQDVLQRCSAAFKDTTTLLDVLCVIDAASCNENLFTLNTHLPKICKKKKIV